MCVDSNSTRFESRNQVTPEPFNPYAVLPFEMVQSDPLDYWHSLIVYYDGAAFYWQIYDHQNGDCIQALADYHLMRRSALRAGKAFWKALDAARAESEGAK